MRTSEIRKIDPLQMLELFSDITSAEFDSVRGLCFEMHFDDGEVIVRENSTTTDMFVLIEGTVVVEKLDEYGHKRELARLRPETVFGEISMVLGAPRTATVRAHGPAEVVRVDGERFQELRSSGHVAALKVAYNTLEMLAERQSATNDQLLELADKLDTQNGEKLQDDVSALRDKLMDKWSF
ncbi:MAG: cyclic nucleotide-binding domain-containing protein [Myxococcota bacterium]